MTLHVRPAEAGDFDPIWRMECADAELERVPRPAPAEVREFWFGEGIRPYVAERDGAVIGAYRLRAIRPGPGSHVAHASFLVDPPRRGRGVGSELAAHALDEARRTGFRAMQFGFVPCTRTGSVALWRRLGFSIVGTLPSCFQDTRHGMVDAYVLHRAFGEP
jgi:L-amino acid N-acyltransferase YncA